VGNLPLYRGFIAAHMKAQMEYRFGFFVQHIVLMLYYCISYLGLWIVLEKFQTIAGWTFYEVLLLFSLNLFAYSISSFFFGFGSMRNMDRLVQQGTFDSLLIFPLNPLVHLALKHFSNSYVAHSILCIVIFVVCFEELDIKLGPLDVLLFCGVLIGGALIQAAAMIATGTISFWFVRSTSAVDGAMQYTAKFVDYPIVIYQRWVQVVLTFVLPFAFISFYPAETFLGRNNTSVLHGILIFDPLFQFGTPLVGAVLFFLAYRFWKCGINHYQSTGT